MTKLPAVLLILYSVCSISNGKENGLRTFHEGELEAVEDNSAIYTSGSIVSSKMTALQQSQEEEWELFEEYDLNSYENISSIAIDSWRDNGLKKVLEEDLDLDEEFFPSYQNSTNNGLNLSQQERSLNGCKSNQRSVKIDILTDDNGWEISWTFRLQGERNTIARSGTYDSNERDIRAGCMDIGFYVFNIKDIFGDGLSAGNGHYKISVRNADGSWRLAVSGKEFGSSVTHLIDVGQTESTMTDRDYMYLESHNKRRKDWHERYNTEYRPLKWSNGLKEISLKYAAEVLKTCKTTNKPAHDPNTPYAENMARNKGVGGWAQLYSPDQIVGRFVDREEGLPWAKNSHLTNALWRATKYVGCAEASGTYMDVNKNGKEIEKTCRVQICRYSKPGNCNMKKYKGDWLTPMLADNTLCTPECPPEGCIL